MATYRGLIVHRRPEHRESRPCGEYSDRGHRRRHGPDRGPVRPGQPGTDDQNLTGASLNASNILQIDIEDGTSTTVDLSALNDSGTDDQALSLSGNTLTLEDGGTVDLAGYLDNTDDQALSLSGNTLTLEDGGTVDLCGYLDNTDDQALSLSGNTLTLEDGGTVDLTGYLDNTDDQAITDFSLDGATHILTLTLEDGGTQTVDLSGFVSTDDQNLALTGNTLEIEDGNNVDLSGYLDNTDDQQLTLATNTLTLEDGGTVDLSGYLDNTDDQVLSLSGNTLTLEDGGTVDLSGYLDNTDDQTVTAFAIDNATNVLTITLEDGNTRTVDLSVLDNSGTDDQTISLTGNTLTLEDGGTVDLSGYFDNTDDQAITDFSLDGTTNILTLTLEDGGTQTVDLSGFVSTDDQRAFPVRQHAHTRRWRYGGSFGYLDNTDDQALSLSGNTLTLEDGGTRRPFRLPRQHRRAGSFPFPVTL